VHSRFTPHSHFTASFFSFLTYSLFVLCTLHVSRFSGVSSLPHLPGFWDFSSALPASLFSDFSFSGSLSLTLDHVLHNSLSLCMDALFLLSFSRFWVFLLDAYIPVSLLLHLTCLHLLWREVFFLVGPRFHLLFTATLGLHHSLSALRWNFWRFSLSAPFWVPRYSWDLGLWVGFSLGGWVSPVCHCISLGGNFLGISYLPGSFTALGLCTGCLGLEEESCLLSPAFSLRSSLFFLIFSGSCLGPCLFSLPFSRFSLPTDFHVPHHCLLYFRFSCSLHSSAAPFWVTSAPRYTFSLEWIWNFLFRFVLDSFSFSFFTAIVFSPLSLSRVLSFRFLTSHCTLSYSLPAFHVCLSPAYSRLFLSGSCTPAPILYSLSLPP